ncbi:TPA: restriction endonuclease subunit S [Streptococcus equi subsp. zooepidemicus]|nr:restriction endonuclease subunit S [Streptococcus equi subsp. zooepidemicus]
MKLGEVCDSISVTFDKTKQKVVLVNTSDVFNGKVTNHALVDNKGLKGQFKKTFQKGDILYSEIRPKNKRFAFIDFNANDYVASTKLMVIRANKKVLPQYLYQVLKSEEVINQLQSLAESRSGTFPQITFSELAQIDARIPELAEQKEIADFLKLFDDKIELNNKINHHLAELIDAQFAHLLEDNELYKSTFSEIGEIVGGGTPSKKVDDYWNGDIPWLSPKDLSLNPAMFTGRGQNSITELGYKKSSAKLMPRNSILFSSRAPIGYITIAENDISTNQGFKSIIPKPEYPYTFVYELLKQETPSLESSASGSTFKEVSGTHLKNHEIRIPPHSAIIKFHESVEPLFKTINLNEKEIQKLIEVRDLLLPTLMSGEISVSD